MRTSGGTVKNFATSKVRYIQLFYKGLLSQGEQTLVRYMESSYYREFVIAESYYRLWYYRPFRIELHRIC